MDQDCVLAAMATPGATEKINFLKDNSRFDRLAAKSGQQALYRKLLRDFPMTVKP
jgi:hypothetical protein